MSKKRSVLNSVLLASMIAAPSLNAIQKSTANVGAVLVAVASGAGSWVAWNGSLRKINPLFFIVPSIGVTGLAYKQLHSITPQGRLKRATVLLDKVARNVLVDFFNTDNDFFNMLYSAYLTDDLPLICAYNELTTMLPHVRSAFELLNKALPQADTNQTLKATCTAALSRSQEMFTNISSAIRRIREHKDYLSQLQIYKQFLANEKQLLVQQQMADAQLQTAHAQSSSTFLKWLKAIFWGK